MYEAWGSGEWLPWGEHRGEAGGGAKALMLVDREAWIEVNAKALTWIDREAWIEVSAKAQTWIDREAWDPSKR